MPGLERILQIRAPCDLGARAIKDNNMIRRDFELQEEYSKKLITGTPEERKHSLWLWLQAYERASKPTPKSGKMVLGCSDMASRSGQLSLAAIEATDKGTRSASLEEIKQVLRRWGDAGGLWNDKRNHYSNYMTFEKGWATFDKKNKTLTMTDEGRNLVLSCQVSEVWEQLDHALPFEIALSDVVIQDHLLVEGAICRIAVNAYERNPKARQLCIEVYGTSCYVCGFSFGLKYGSIAEGYIHVHHLRPLSEIASDYVVDPIKDLRPVCPNCHAVLHLGNQCRSIDEIKELIDHKHF